MKKTLALFLLFYLVIDCMSQSKSEYNYTYSDSVYVNPEKGFYKYTERSSTASTLNISTLNNFRDQGYTLIYRIFYLNEFVNSPISNAYLEKVKEDFSKIRTSGIKAIVRFAYTASMEAPYGDASPDRVNEHINQLSPIFKDNADVILILQAGFIGAWGEWYYTDHFATDSPDNITEEDLQERKVLVNNLLEALPSDRMIQLRYVGYKMKLFDSIPVTAEEAYSGSPKSRISHHNDCFVSSANDVGSYRNIVFEKDYLEKDSKYTSVGGETCRWYEPRSNCDTSLSETERFHWTFINQDYFGTTINEWQNDGCYLEMQKRLGYRYHLVNSSIQDSAKHNGAFDISFIVRNIGFSNPINYRKVEIVLKNINSGEKFFVPVNIDLRKSELDTDIEINTQIGIPSYMPNGAYEVYLNLPDPKLTLKDNPKYSIRLANNYVWDASIGMNSLNHIVHIDPEYSDDTPYTGSNYFLSFDKIPSHTIEVDGNPSDWEKVTTGGSNTSNTFLKNFKVTQLNDTVFFLLQGINLLPNSQIFIDADNNSSTGMDYWGWADDGGIDYMIQNSELFSYSGANGSGDWTWNLVSSSFLRAANDTVIEIALPESIFSQVPISDSIRLGAVNLSADWSTTTEFVPVAGSSLILSKKNLLNTPKLYVSSYSNNLIVSYAYNEKDTNAVMVIERSEYENNSFQTLSINSNSLGNIFTKDTDLAENRTYYYRAYLMNNEGISAYSSVQAGTTSEGVFKYPIVTVNGDNSDWNSITPLIGVSEPINDLFLKAYCSSEYLTLLIEGDSILDFTVFINTDDNIATGEENLDWNKSGFDFKITTSGVYNYAGGTYSKVADIDSLESGAKALEVKIPLTSIELSNDISRLYFAATATTKDKELLFPYRNRTPVFYERILPADVPENFSVRQSASSPSSKLIASWDKCNNCDGFELIRTNNASGISTSFDFSNTDFQLIDDNLPADTEFEYILNSYNFSGKSEIAGPVELSTSSTNSIEQIVNDKVLIWPNPTSDIIHIKLLDKPGNIMRINVHSINGKLIHSEEVELHGFAEQFNLSLSALGLEGGFYFMRIDLQNSVITEKIILRK